MTTTLTEETTTTEATDASAPASATTDAPSPTDASHGSAEAGAGAAPADTKDTPVSVVPEKYDLKLPEGSTVDPAIVEKTAARARALGLSNEAGQQLLDQTVQDLADAEQAHKAGYDALVEAWKPGGTEYAKRDAQWRDEALKDAEIGGSPEKLASSIEFAQQALNKYGSDLKTYLDETGLGSHPAAIKFLANIGRAMSEGANGGGLVLGNGGPMAKPKSDAQLLYPNLYDESGRPKPVEA